MLAKQVGLAFAQRKAAKLSMPEFEMSAPFHRLSTSQKKPIAIDRLQTFFKRGRDRTLRPCPALHGSAMSEDIRFVPARQVEFCAGRQEVET